MEQDLGVQFLTDVIERLRGGRPIAVDTNLKQVLAGIAGAGLHRLGAIRELIGIGAFPEAAILARSLIELQISVAYIVSSAAPAREDNAQRFLAFELRQRCELLGRASMEYTDVSFLDADTPIGNRAEHIRAEFAEACQEFEALEKSKNWGKRSGVGLRG